VARRHNFNRPRQSRGRLTQWIGPPLQSYVAVSSAGATLVSSATFEEPITQVRTRGIVSIRPASTAADVDITGAFGIGVVSAEAFAAGVGSIPEPYTDGDWGGWFVWRTFSMSIQFESATGVRDLTQNFEVDSKAMRKLSPNETMVFIAESQVGAFQIADCTRQLIMLS